MGRVRTVVGGLVSVPALVVLEVVRRSVGDVAPTVRDQHPPGEVAAVVAGPRSWLAVLTDQLDDAAGRVGDLDPALTDPRYVADALAAVGRLRTQLRRVAAGVDGSARCGWCGVPFVPLDRRGRWCSARCRQAAYRDRTS